MPHHIPPQLIQKPNVCMQVLSGPTHVVYIRSDKGEPICQQCYCYSCGLALNSKMTNHSFIVICWSINCPSILCVHLSKVICKEFLQVYSSNVAADGREQHYSHYLFTSSPIHCWLGRQESVSGRSREGCLETQVYKNLNDMHHMQVT